MTVSIMILDLYSENSHSLKDKRKILLSIKERLRQKYNISLIESNYQNLWQKMQLTIALAAGTKTIADKTFTQIENFILSHYAVEILKIEKEYL